MMIHRFAAGLVVGIFLKRGIKALIVGAIELAIVLWLLSEVDVVSISVDLGRLLEMINSLRTMKLSLTTPGLIDLIAFIAGVVIGNRIG